MELWIGQKIVPAPRTQLPLTLPGLAGPFQQKVLLGVSISLLFLFIFFIFLGFRFWNPRWEGRPCFPSVPPSKPSVEAGEQSHTHTPRWAPTGREVMCVSVTVAKTLCYLAVRGCLRWVSGVRDKEKDNPGCGPAAAAAEAAAAAAAGPGLIC